MATHFESCPNVPSPSRMSLNAPRMHIDCCRNLINEFSWNALRMPSETGDSCSNAVRMLSERPEL